MLDSMYSHAQIELFHLLFTRHLGEKVDKNLFALKGGCNLRFYFKSIRYSEDIDFDVRTIAKDTLKNQVTKLLESTPFQQVLRTKKMEVIDVSAPKQTDTTQRWKLKIKTSASSLAIPTKIEFSRRGMKEGLAFDPVDAELISKAGLYPILCNHYIRESAIEQKIDALIHRTETQARDVFDLNLLTETTPTPLKLSELKDLDKASENLMSISYSDYKAQVVSYLKSEYQDHFGSARAWNSMQEKVLKVLNETSRRA